MALNYTPEPRAVELAEATLKMKIRVQAVLDAIDEEKRKYRERMGFVLDAAENTILHHADPGTPDDAFEDLRVEAAVRDREVLEDVEQTLEMMFGASERGLESMRDEIEGQILFAVQIPSLLADAELKEDRKSAISKTIEIALWQAMTLLDLDEYENAGLVQQAEDIICDQLGHTRN